METMADVALDSIEGKGTSVFCSSNQHLAKARMLEAVLHRGQQPPVQQLT